MRASSLALKLTDAEVATPLGQVRTVRRTWDAPIDVHGCPREHWLELALLPRSNEARGCFPDRWGPHRYEPIGELFLLPAGQPFHARSACASQSSIICAFKPAAVQAWLDVEVDWDGARLHRSLDIADARLRELVFRLGEEAAAPGFASEALVELLLGQIAIELGRRFAAFAGERAAGGLAPWRLRLIEERLAEPGAAPSIAELAMLCGLSARQLTRSFRESRGCSIGEHLARSRAERAKRLLAGQQALKAIAHELGFSSASNFCVAFRRATGETPRDYRQRAGRPAARRMGTRR